MTDTIHVDFCVTPRPGVFDVEGRVEVIVYNYGALPTRFDPGTGPEWELGAIELIVGHEGDIKTGLIRYIYDALTDSEDDHSLDRMIRKRLMACETFADNVAHEIQNERHAA